MSQAESVFNQVFATCMRRFEMILTFRATSEVSLEAGLENIRRIERSQIESFFRNPANDRLFKDKLGFLEMAGGIEKLAQWGFDKRVTTFRASIDAASLVFAHSVVDSAAFDLCRVTGMVSPESWERFVAKKSIELGEVKARNYQEMLTDQVDKHMASLEKQSLLAKIDVLFSICKPPTGFSPIEDYIYDREQVLKFDDLRHEIVHGSGPVSLPRGVNDIWYLRRTTLFLLALVNERFDLKLIGDEVFKHMA